MQAEVPTRRILEEALRTSATSIVLVHNHPSGNAEPSSGDIRLTDEGITICPLDVAVVSTICLLLQLEKEVCQPMECESVVAG